MNIEHVKTFLEVAATGNFNRAAETMNVVQSTVSARIKSLEDSLDRSLFQRNRQGAELTAAGHQFHRYAMMLVQTWEHARMEVALPSGYRTLFGLGAQVSLWERLILKWIPWMRASAPDVSLRLEADYSGSQMRQLSDGLLDVGVMYTPRNVSGLEIEELLVEKLILVATSDRPLSEKGIDGLINVDWGYEVGTEMSKAFPELEPPPISVGLGALGLQYILDHGGAGYQPMRVVQPLLADGRLVRIDGAPEFRRPAYMVFSSKPDDPDLQATALEGLRDIASRETDE